MPERAAIAWQLYRDAASVDPEIAEDWKALQQLRHETFEMILAKLPETALRQDPTRKTAVDTAWAIASPETYDILVRHANYTLDRYEQWVAATLVARLLRQTLPR